jgi:hypothetical protein
MWMEMNVKKIMLNIPWLQKDIPMVRENQIKEA